MGHIPNFVARFRQSARGGRTLEVRNPIDGSTLGQVGLSDAMEVSRGVDC